jgi:hypothetical protein
MTDDDVNVPAFRLGAEAVPVDPASPVLTVPVPGSGLVPEPGSGVAVRDAVLVPELPQIEGPQTAAERAYVTVLMLARHARQQARKRRAARPDGLWAGLYRTPPPSVEDHLAYGKSGAWVPKGHEGALVPFAGKFYNRTLGLACVILGNSISGGGHKPLRGSIAALAAIVIIAVIAVIISKL